MRRLGRREVGEDKSHVTDTKTEGKNMINATKKGKNRGHSDSQAGTISASKKVMWAPHNERNVLMSVDWKG